MINNLPGYISIAFGLTALLALILFYIVLKRSTVETARSKATIIIVFLITWIVIQSLLAFNNFYTAYTKNFPPRFFLAVAPMLFTIVIIFVTKRGRNFIDGLPLVNITYVNIVRIPVEIVLYWLAMNKAVPELMTFTGRNFDILSGITAPFIAYFGFTVKKLDPKLILLWNFIALGLLINIIVNAVLSAPFSFQQFAFDQPNIAVLYFPFTLLPAFIVPVVLFGHLVSIRQLLKTKNSK
jgi:hypothetical protein